MTVPVSVVVPVHNQAALTRACLDALLMELPGGWEVVVVDDASTDATAALLRGYGEAIRVVSLTRNAGYARACNEGAAAAAGEALLFLNNDTVPHPGCLRELIAYANAHPDASVVGAKLLYPSGSVQHAGVVIGQDGYPHNLYAGLSPDHPVVNRSRRLQAVTGACMLVRRGAFDGVEGFDTGFLNSLEDVDLCLRIGEHGGEIHYCHRVAVTHRESASRGREGRFEQSVALYRRRWRDRVRRDDLGVYLEDGLLSLEYAETYPLRIEVSPQLAAVDAGREVEAESLLETYARQVSDLLAEVVRLTAALGDPKWGSGPVGGGATVNPTLDHTEFVREANRLEEGVRRLQGWLELPEAGAESFLASRRLGYRHLVEQVRAAIAATVPAGASVLVVSRGDRQLVELGERTGGHFPQDAEGRYLGHHPHDSEEAIAYLEALRTCGAEYLVLPATSRWWLEHYDRFAEHLRDRYPATELDACTIYRLGRVPSEIVAMEATG